MQRKMAIEIGLRPTGMISRMFQKNRVSKYKGLCGPMGSGKTTAIIDDIQRNTMERPPNKNGVRESKWLCVRSTSKESVSSAMASWTDQYSTTPTVIKRNVSEGTSSGRIIMEFNCPLSKKYQKFFKEGLVRIEVQFIGVKLHVLEDKLKGTNLTGIWLNEVDLLEPQVFSFASGRVRRFPSMADKPDYITKDEWLRGCHVIGDCNPPDGDNWYPELIKNAGMQVFRDTDPETVRRIESGEIGKNVLYRQPSGVSPEAENLENLHKDYYNDMIVDNYNDEDFIRKNVHGEFGKANKKNRGVIYKNVFSNCRHLVDGIAYDKTIPIIAGMDVGFNNACILTQFVDNQIRVLSEILCEDESRMPTDSFIEEVLRPQLMQRYNISLNGNIKFCVDPTSKNRSAVQGVSTAAILMASGMNIAMAPTNDINYRLNVVRRRLLNQIKGDHPALIIDKTKCPVLIAGFRKTYKFSEGSLTSRDKPSKSFSSHIHDALQYLISYIDDPNQRDPLLWGPAGSSISLFQRQNRPLSSNYGSVFCP